MNLSDELFIERKAQSLTPSNLFMWWLAKVLNNEPIPKDWYDGIIQFFIDSGVQASYNYEDTFHLVAGVQETTLKMPSWLECLADQLGYTFQSNPIQISEAFVREIVQEGYESRERWEKMIGEDE